VCLFPSRRSDSEHDSWQTIWRRFQKLADDAGLPACLEGEQPLPQLCRRFCYDRHSEPLEEVIAGLEDVAAEQASSDPKSSSGTTENVPGNCGASQCERNFLMR